MKIKKMVTSIILVFSISISASAANANPSPMEQFKKLKLENIKIADYGISCKSRKPIFEPEKQAELKVLFSTLAEDYIATSSDFKLALMRGTELEWEKYARAFMEKINDNSFKDKDGNYQLCIKEKK